MLQGGTRVGDLLSKLGIPADVIDQRLGELAKAPLAALRDLRLAYGGAVGDTNKFGRDVADSRVDFPPFGHYPTPQLALTSLRDLVEGTYYHPNAPSHPTRRDLFGRLLNPRTQRAAKLAILLNQNRIVRASFERIAGGEVVPDRRMDGKITMREAARTAGATGAAKSAMTALPPPPPLPSSNVYDLFKAMDQAVLDQAASLRPGNGSFTDLGKGSLLGPELGVGSGRRGGSAQASGGFDGENESEDEEDGGSFGSSSHGITGDADPFGRVFDTQQGSVDSGTLRLKRLIDKRDQMYDLYRQTFTTYNQAARQVIEAMKS